MNRKPKNHLEQIETLEGLTHRVSSTEKEFLEKVDKAQIHIINLRMNKEQMKQLRSVTFKLAEAQDAIHLSRAEVIRKLLNYADSLSSEQLGRIANKTT